MKNSDENRNNDELEWQSVNKPPEFDSLKVRKFLTLGLWKTRK